MTKEPKDSLRDKTIRGLNWSLLNQVINQLFGIVIVVILARLLTPRDFGLVAMVLVLTQFSFIIQDFGLGSSIVQKTKSLQKSLATIFWLNVAMGAFLMVILVLAAPLIVAFYNEAILYNIVLVSASVFFIRSLNIVHNALLQRDMDFRSIFIVRLCATILAGLIAIALALNGYGVWSLVFQALASAIVTTVVLWTVSPWRPTMEFEFASIKEHLEFSIPLLGSRSLGYWVRNIDYILIGKFIGDVALGFYQKAYAIMLLPLRNVTRVVGNVLFPSLSQIQDDKARVKSIFLRATRIIAFITFPLSVILLVNAESFVLVVLGEQWTGTIPVLRILSLVSIIQSVSSLVANLFTAQGATTVQFKLNLLFKINTIAWIAFGIRWGIEGVAICYLIALLIKFVPNVFVAGRLVNLNLGEYFRNLFPLLILSVVSASIALALDLNLLVELPHLVRLLLGCLVVGGIYLGCATLFRLSALADLKMFLTNSLGQIRA